MIREYLLKKLDNKKDILKFTIISSIILFWLSHGFRFFNLCFTHDGLSIVEHDINWQVSIGRYLQPVLYIIRGDLSAPWLFNLISMFWMALSVYYLVDMFEIVRPVSILAISSIMICNNIITLSNATYMQWMDIYSLCLFLSVYSIWLIRKDHKKSYLAIILLFISMGLYQSYICVAIGLVMIMMMLELHDDKKSVKEIIRDGVCRALVILISAILFYVVWKIVLKISGIEALSHYGSDSGISDYVSSEMKYALYRTYKNVAIYLRRPYLFCTSLPAAEKITEYIVFFVNLLILAYIGLSCLIKNVIRNKKPVRFIWQMIIYALLPMGINFVCILTLGSEHDLMMYGVCIIFILPLLLLEKSSDAESRFVRIRPVFIGYIFLLAWMNVVFSNQVYLEKALLDESANSLVTRLVEDIESVDGYEVGVTPVAFMGCYDDSDYHDDIEGFETLKGTGLMTSAFSTSRTFGYYIHYVLNNNMYIINLTPEPDELSEMTCYPTEGSVKMIDGVVVVKFSNTPTNY